ncbi:hypothetical protein BOX15_Mlig006384g4 [Macrostomum lignano]|uniref:Regulator of chromosome condensation n=2 Tax=Macrostomum lignano TaxID=282301 RepID=A0A267DFL8_9PLAT|nr:hypothetical protein BOX15_Mlig006384g4 [Macrostomum lignano]
MDASELNFDIPDSGAIFAFGKNVPNRFYVKNDKIVSMDCGEGHAVMVAASGRVFGFGLNDYGQLGLGSKATQAKPAVVKQLKEDGVKAVKVACGPTHTLVLADDGIVYGYGNNSDGQITGDEADFTRPVEVEQLENVEVRDLAAGRAFSLAVSKKGELLAWGGNTEGCLGQEDPDLPGSPDPMPVHLPGRVAAVSAGSYHCACVLTDGRLYAWGETERGKLGIRNAEDQEFLFSPQPVPVPGRVQMVSCGLEHTLVLTENGRVYVCGSGESGQLGLGTGCTYAPTVKVVSGLEKLKVACVAAGERHSMCVCSRTGQLYAFGDPQHGKLGFKPATSGGGGGGSRYSSSASGGCLFEPTLVTALRPISVQQVVCGTLLTAVLAVPAKDAGGGSGRSSSLARPGSSSDNEADDKLPALRGRASSLGRRGSFQELNNNNSGIGTSASLADRRVGGGRLAPLSLNGAERPAPSGSLDRSGRFSPLALRGSSSPRYGSDSDALKPSKKLDPIKQRDGDLAGSSRRPRNSTAATKFDSLLMGPSDSQDSQSDNEDEKRLKGSGSRQRGKPSGRLGRDQSPPPSSRAAGRSGGRGGSKPLKPIGHSDEDEENSDKDFGRGRAGRGGRKDGNNKIKDAADSRRKTRGRALSRSEDEDDETDEENDRRLTSPSRRRRMSSEGKEPAGRRDSREGDSGVAKGIGCGRGGRSGGDGKTRSCQVL